MRWQPRDGAVTEIECWNQSICGMLLLAEDAVVLSENEDEEDNGAQEQVFCCAGWAMMKDEAEEESVKKTDSHERTIFIARLSKKASQRQEEGAGKGGKQ